VQEGVRREAVYKDGEYLDNIMMSILFPTTDDRD
jgi:hypothetical protein